MLQRLLLTRKEEDQLISPLLGQLHSSAHHIVLFHNYPPPPPPPPPSCLYPLYTGAATFVSPLCDHKMARSPLKVERRPNGCLGRSRVVHRTFRHRHGCHGRREVLNMFKTVAQRSPGRSVAHRSLKGGRRKAQISPWSQNGYIVVGHRSPRKKCVRLWT